MVNTTITPPKRLKIALKWLFKSRNLIVICSFFYECDGQTIVNKQSQSVTAPMP